MNQLKLFSHPFSGIILVCIILPGIILSGYKKPVTNQDEYILYVKNPSGGPLLGYSESSGVKIITQNGFFFKDLNKNGKLDPYEDWRLPVDTRAKNLASMMSIDQIAGLMLYSRHQAIPASVQGIGRRNIQRESHLLKAVRRHQTSPISKRNFLQKII